MVEDALLAAGADLHIDARSSQRHHRAIAVQRRRRHLVILKDLNSPRMSCMIPTCQLNLCD